MMTDNTKAVLFILARTIIVGGVFGVACALMGPDVARNVRDSVKNIFTA